MSTKHYETTKESLIEEIKRRQEDKIIEKSNADLLIKLIDKADDLNEALQNLLIEYKGKVDVIYIDPPYGKDSMGEFAHTNYDNAITRDNLLSMLYSRLVLAKELLSDTGVIFCSIDDKNQAYVKCLFDEVFGEQNFIANLVWTNEEGGGSSDSTFFKIKHEYILCYANYKFNVGNVKNVQNCDDLIGIDIIFILVYFDIICYYNNGNGTI